MSSVCCIHTNGEIIILLPVRQSLHVMLTEGFQQQTCREAQPVLANQKAERVHLVLEFLHFSPTKCAIMMFNFMLIQFNIRYVNQLPQQ